MSFCFFLSDQPNYQSDYQSVKKSQSFSQSDSLSCCLSVSECRSAPVRQSVRSQSFSQSDSVLLSSQYVVLFVSSVKFSLYVNLLVSQSVSQSIWLRGSVWLITVLGQSVCWFCLIAWPLESCSFPWTVKEGMWTGKSPLFDGEKKSKRNCKHKTGRSEEWKVNITRIL